MEGVLVHSLVTLEVGACVRLSRITIMKCPSCNATVKRRGLWSHIRNRKNKQCAAAFKARGTEFGTELNRTRKWKKNQGRNSKKYAQNPPAEYSLGTLKLSGQCLQ